MKRRPAIGLMGSATLLALVASGCGSNVVVWDGTTMGTTYRVKAARARIGEPERQEIHAAIDAALDTINRQMSTYDPQSDISRFNASRSTDPFPVSPATTQVVQESLRVWQESEGGFDITVGPLVELWGFGPAGRRTEPPTDAEIVRTKAATGSGKLAVSLDPPHLRKQDPDLRLDLGAIAPGYAADVVSRLLLERGLSEHMVEIGGEVVARGRNPDGSPWKIGIEEPSPTALDPRRGSGLVVELSDSALATSGNYRNFFLHEGKRYSHTIDPATGRPVNHPLASVSVVATSCMRADALATAAMVLGPEKGLPLLETLPDAEGVFLVGDENGQWRQLSTSGMSRLLSRGP